MISLERVKQEILEAISPILDIDLNLSKIYIFGSYATGKNTIFSDVDLAFVVEDVSKVKRGQYRIYLDEFEYDVDIVCTTLNQLQESISPLNVNTSIREGGIVIWERK